MKINNVYGIIFQLIEEGDIKESERNDIKGLVEAAAGKAGISFNIYTDKEKIVIVSVHPKIEGVGEEVFNNFDGELQMSERIVLFVLEETPSGKASEFDTSSLGI